MRTIHITLEYEGTHYCGWQLQQNGVTIQQKLSEALHQLTGSQITIHGSGRTDAGVHARGQAASFETDSLIPADRFARAINAHLPEDIAVIEAREATPDFHARYSALGKQYSYQLIINPQRSPLMRHFAWELRQVPDLDRIRQSLKLFEGTHDFGAFRSVKSDKINSVRTIWKADLKQKGNSVWLIYQGDGFLYKMVRMLTAAAVHAGFGWMSLEEIAERLASGHTLNRKMAAPPHGLYLDKVYYDPDELPKTDESCQIS
jgi:tRNA pseudouridine38-40 synthase